MISSLGLLWTVYTFFIKKNEERAQKERETLMDKVKDLSNKTTDENRALREQFGAMQKEIEKVKTMAYKATSSIDAQSQLLISQANLFDTKLTLIQKQLDRQETRLESYGSIKVK
jgi:hypothetical protein